MVLLLTCARGIANRWPILSLHHSRRVGPGLPPWPGDLERSTGIHRHSCSVDRRQHVFFRGQPVLPLQRRGIQGTACLSLHACVSWMPGVYLVISLCQNEWRIVWYESLFFRQVAITTRAITAGGWAVLAQISWRRGRRRRRMKATSVTQPAPRTQPATQRLHQRQHHSRWSPHCCASSLRQYDNYGFFSRIYVHKYMYF